MPRGSLNATRSAQRHEERPTAFAVQVPVLTIVQKRDKLFYADVCPLRSNGKYVVKKGEIPMAAKKNVATTAAKTETVVKEPVKVNTTIKAEAEKKEPVKAETEKKETVKTVAEKKAPVEKKETAEKKPVEKKPVAKKTATKKAVKAEMKSAVYVQFAGKSYSQEDLVKIAKDVWKYDLKQKAKDLVSVELYVKPEESMVYYVMNKDFAGSFYI